MKNAPERRLQNIYHRVKDCRVNGSPCQVGTVQWWRESMQTTQWIKTRSWMTSCQQIRILMSLFSHNPRNPQVNTSLIDLYIQLKRWQLWTYTIYLSIFLSLYLLTITFLCAFLYGSQVEVTTEKIPSMHFHTKSKVTEVNAEQRMHYAWKFFHRQNNTKQPTSLIKDGLMHFSVSQPLSPPHKPCITPTTHPHWTSKMNKSGLPSLLCNILESTSSKALTWKIKFIFRY